jgi:hypothetical protein
MLKGFELPAGREERLRLAMAGIGFPIVSVTNWGESGASVAMRR